jgi:hypothetical protein
MIDNSLDRIKNNCSVKSLLNAAKSLSLPGRNLNPEPALQQARALPSELGSTLS